MNVSNTGIVRVKNISEIGPADGLVAWYPLQGDVKDYANGMDALNDGATPTVRGYHFDDTNPRIFVTTESMIPTSHTISCWILKTVHNPVSYPIFLSYHLPYIACNSSSHPFRVSYRNASGQTNVSGITIPHLNVWYHVVGTFSVDGVRIYVNGYYEGINSTPSVNTGNSFLMGGHNTGTQYRIDGSISDVRIYNRALSEEEVAVLYEMTNPELNNRIKQTKDCLYVKGQIQET